MDSTTQKGFMILERLAQSDQPRGVTDLAKETGLTKSNVQRILNTLVELGYAGRDDQSSKYLSTLRMWELGVYVLNRNELVRIARPHLLDLRAKTGETVVLCLPQDDDVLFVNKLESNRPIRNTLPLGSRRSSLSNAPGRAIAAFMLAPHLLPGFDQEVEEQLNIIRARGYELKLGDERPGINTLAMPILTSQGTAAASIGITGPEERVTMDIVNEWRHHLFETTSAISSSLGPYDSR